MPEPIVITVSHRLGRDEAKRRLDSKLSDIRAQLAGIGSAIDYAWTNYRLDFGLLAMRQRIVGRIDIEDKLVRVELALPFLLRLLANRIIGRVQTEGSRLLDQPAGRPLTNAG